MVTQEQIKQNYKKILKLKELVQMMAHKHETAMFTYMVNGVEKQLPENDIYKIIEDYQALKTQCQDKFKELL